MSNLTSTKPSKASQISLLICDELSEKITPDVTEVLFEHLDYNEARKLAVLDLSKTKDGGETWLKWISDKKLPASKSDELVRFDGGFEKWPKFSDGLANQLEDFLNKARAQDRDILILTNCYESEKRSCLILCQLVDQIFVFAEEGKTPLKKLKKIESSLTKAGAGKTSTILVRKKNWLLNWLSGLLE